MCIRDSIYVVSKAPPPPDHFAGFIDLNTTHPNDKPEHLQSLENESRTTGRQMDFVDNSCLLYTSDAADERSSVDLGGRRIIKKKKRNTISGNGHT